jgi:hypothetical protein
MPEIVGYHVTERSGNDSQTTEDTIQEKIVIVVSEPVSMEWIARHPRTPKLNTQHRMHPGFYFETITPKQISALAWELDTRCTTFQFPDMPESPLNEPAEISIDSNEITEPTLFDYKLRPITTTAGEWLADVTVERCHWVYKVSKNVGSDPAWLDDYGAAINSDPVRLRGRVRPKHSLMLRRLSMTPYTTKNKVSFSRLSFELHYRPELWIQQKWNMGTIQLVEFTTAENKKAWRQEKILSGSPAAPIDKPVPIGKDGKVIPGALNPSGDQPFDVSKLISLPVQTQVDRSFRVLPLN